MKTSAVRATALDPLSRYHHQINRNQYAIFWEICCFSLNDRAKLQPIWLFDQPILEVELVLTRPETTEREDAIAALRAFIAEGAYAPGDRLPPERALIGNLGMPRTILRKALDVLEREGTIWRHVGKGTFMAANGWSETAGNLTEISRRLTPVRMIRARLCIEPAIAREAAINASAEAIVRVKNARDRAAEASSWADYEAQDDLFHRAIAEASDNILLLSLFDQLNRVHRAVAWGSVVRGSKRPPDGHSSFIEHDRIAAAIEAREPAAAQESMRRHIGSVSARLFGEV